MMCAIRNNHYTKVILLCIFIIFAANFLLAQDPLYVDGHVLSGSGKPVPGVTISVIGSADRPAVTDGDGYFKVRVLSGNNWLIVSPTRGFKEQTVFLNNRNNLTIYLTSEDVLSGYDPVNLVSHTLNRRNIVSSVDYLNTNDIHHIAAFSIDEYMEGRIPGMHVIKRSGDPASGAVTLLRGINSIHANTQPLYVVDGVPMLLSGVFGTKLNGYSYNPLLLLNPYDISQTTVTKDPAISAAYGSKGSNGIIFIETLDPNVTETIIELDVRGGYSFTPPSFIPQLNAKQHKTLMNEVLFTSPLFEEQIREIYPNLFLNSDDKRHIDYQHNTNWQDLVFEDAGFTDINLAIKGGDEIAQYGLSVGHTNSSGIIRGTGYEGYNLRFVSRMNIFRWLQMNAGVALNYNTLSLKETASPEGTSPIVASLAKSPLSSPYQYDFQGNRIMRVTEVDELGISNPLAIVNNYSADNTNYNFISNLNLKSVINNDLSVNTVLSLNYNSQREHIFMPNRGMALYFDQEAINVAKSTNNSIMTFFSNNHLLYNKSSGDHSFSSSTGFNIQTNSFQNDWGLTRNAPENDRYRTIGDGQGNLREIGGQNLRWNWLSFYEYLNYAYKDRYLLSASLSLDGSSRIGRNADNTISLAGQPFGLFYGAGIGWRISDESFLKGFSWLDEFKIRASYGKSGNDAIGELSASRYYRSALYRETTGLYPANLPNDRLTFETVTRLNSGIDLAFLGSRILAKLDYFVSTTDDMFIMNPLAPYFGYYGRIENGGSMRNHGWELFAFSRLIDGTSFKWDIQASLSSVINEVTSVKGGRLVSDIPGAQVVNQPGSPANSFYGYIFQGVYSSTEQAKAAGLVNERGIPYQAGDAIFADLSGPEGVPDGVINDFDKTVIGSTLPEWFGGLANTFSYNRWSIGTFLNFASGNDIFNFVRYTNERMTNLDNQSVSTLKRWQYEGHDTEIPRALWNDPVGNSSFSSRWIEDGSFIRIKNISLSYKVPSQFLAFKNAEFYFSVTNPFVFSNYLGYDPGFAYTSSSPGIDYGQTPQPRQFMGGIKFGL
jgi:TonB-linked SusC/RagA family outer membrane protein